MKIEIKQSKLRKIYIFIIVISFLLTFITYLVMVYNNQVNARNTGTLWINQTNTVLENNDKEALTFMESLKDEYLIRARMVSYMFNKQPELESDIELMKKVCSQLSIDELYFFNESGVIYSGTNPEYFGISLYDGEQIGYFKPMLDDKSLVMCQDVEPNTAEGKEMMYAMVWNYDRTKMIQVGIEPKRLLNLMKKNELSVVVSNMPVDRNVNIYVADINSGNIIGSTNGKTGNTLQSIGILYSYLDKDKIHHSNKVVDGKMSVVSVMSHDKYVIGVVQTIEGMREKSAIPMLIIVICIAMSAILILLVTRKLFFAKRDQLEQYNVLKSMSEIYYSMHLVDIEKNTIVTYAAQNHVKAINDKNGTLNASETVKEIMHATMSNEYLEEGLKFCDLSTLAMRLKGKKGIYKELLGKNVGWIRMAFITINTDEEGLATKVICTTQIIDNEKRKEERLVRESITDQLTHCFNRRAYETDINGVKEDFSNMNFVLVSMDVNGLKTVNDSLGHLAGDELLLGAADCMRNCFSSYGRVYRLGGDEFMAILYVEENMLDKIKADFEASLSEWSGDLVDNLSVSYGYVTKREFPDMSITEMEELADKRMYKAKEKYYKQSDTDRRKQV